MFKLDGKRISFAIFKRIYFKLIKKSGVFWLIGIKFSGFTQFLINIAHKYASFFEGSLFIISNKVLIASTGFCEIKILRSSSALERISLLGFVNS